MAELQYETLSFMEKEDDVVVTLLKLFKTSIPKAELAKIAGYKVEKNKIVFNLGQKKAEFRFSSLLNKHFEYLKNIIIYAISSFYRLFFNLFGSEQPYKQLK